MIKGECLVNIKIIADSTCDLPEELILRHNIRIVPLSITKGDELLKDGIDIKPKEIFEYMESGKGTCKTSAVNVMEYTDVYNEEKSKCDAIIHFFISAEMSACYQNARLAAEAFDNIYLIDARNLSCGIGNLVLDAAIMAQSGKTAEEINAEIKRLIPLLDTGFIIDTLTYLHKGGRCSAVQALASSVLKIKPSIVVTDGKMVVGKKYRGNLEIVLRKYIEDRLSDKENIDPRRILIANTMPQENQELVDMAKSIIMENINFKEAHIVAAGSTISCHCGPNTLGLMFFRKT